MAQLAAENPASRNAIIYDVANDYSVGLRNAFKATFEELRERLSWRSLTPLAIQTSVLNSYHWQCATRIPVYLITTPQQGPS